MSHVIHPHLKSVSEYFEDLKGTERFSHYALGAWSQTIAQMALEAQKDALRRMAASNEVVTSYSGLGGHWDAYGSKTEDWKTRAIVMRQKSTHQGYIVVLVKVRPDPNDDGVQILNEAYRRQNKEREGIDLMTSILMGDNEELGGLKADPANFKDFVDCPVDEIKIGFCRSYKKIGELVQKMLENEYCSNRVVEARLNRHTEAFYADRGKPYTIEAQCHASPSDVTDVLQVISDMAEASLVDAAPDVDLIEAGMEFVRKHGVETYSKSNADVIGLAVRSIISSGGLVTEHVQKRLRELNGIITENDEDIDFLPGIPGVLRENGVIGKDAVYDCNDMRNKAYLKDDDVENPVVVFETDNGTYEVRYTAAKDKWPSMIDLYRVAPVSECNRKDTNFLRPNLDGLRQVGSLIEKEGRYQVSPGDAVNPMDGRAIRDLIDIFGSAHTITVCIEDDAKPKAPFSGHDRA